MDSQPAPDTCGEREYIIDGRQLTCDLSRMAGRVRAGITYGQRL